MSEMGVTVTLREIYDEVRKGRNDTAVLRRDVQRMDKRLQAVEAGQKSPASPATLKQAGYVVGLVAAAVASGWGAARGVG